MRDRTLGVILTVLLILLIGVPGIACMCLGLSSFLFGPVLYNQGVSPAWPNTFGAFGLCIGFFLVVITVIISYLLLHRRAETPLVTTAGPIQPISPDKPTPPSNPDEPLPPPM